ncbi:MAG: acyl-CoA dehydrogenase family protein [Planctomycetota bacterium]
MRTPTGADAGGPMIRDPDSPELAALCEALSRRAGENDASGEWPAEQLRLCGDAGVFRWFLPQEVGGLGWDDESVVRGYLALSAACLSTTFVITQRTAASRRIALSENEELKRRLLPGLASGEAFATVGISHLTTSGLHLANPRVAAERVEGGWRVSGAAPWATGAAAADTVVVGAAVVERGEATEEQVLLALPMATPGVSVPEPFHLVGVSASATGAVELDGVFVADADVVAGPVENVLAALSRGASTGGHETSTLALGLARAALDYLSGEADKRADLAEASASLSAEHAVLVADLLSVARGEPACTNESLRTRANSLVLRATQAALAAAKGAGYVSGHPVGRWCREALFFMVWSCPQPVMAANLGELAGIECGARDRSLGTGR